VHLYDPHVPYDPPPDYVARGGGDPYNGEVAYADDHVGRVLDVLKARGLDSSTIVILAGDHGEGLGEHGEGTHGMLAYDATLRVPLAIVDPTDDAPRGAVATPVSLASVAPSLLARLRIDGNAARGADLFARQIADRDVYAETMYPRAAGWHPLTVLAGEQWKLILSSERELFDTRADPAEQRNVIAANERVADGMAGKLREIDAQAKTSGAAVSADTAERLRALGYVSGSTRPPTSSDPNPARVIAAWSTFESALAKVNDARPEEALPALKDLAERYPASSIFLGSYARALKDAGRAREAIAVYRTAIERNPADATLFHDLAIAARAAGDSAEALKAQQAALALNANDPAALNGLGLLHAEAGRAQDAASAFERAVAADPGNASFVTNLANARRELGDQRGAEELYRRALTLDHQHLDAMNGLGVLLVQTRRMEEALPLFERALQMDPEFHEARLNLGIAYQELGRRDAAIKTYSELLERAPASAARERAAAADLLRRLK
jgi:tetratricopeptide (TPR) repeat protein